MQKLLDICVNPDSIQNLYGEFPDFENVELSNLELKREPARVYITFLTPILPKITPTRWDDAVPDFVAVEVCFSHCFDIKVSGWANLALCKFTITKLTEKNFKFCFHGSECSIEGTAEWLQFERFTPIYIE